MSLVRRSGGEESSALVPSAGDAESNERAVLRTCGKRKWSEVEYSPDGDLDAPLPSCRALVVPPPLHPQVHSKAMVCDSCDKMFLSPEATAAHFRAHHGSVCMTCKRDFRTVEEYRDHYVLHHMNQAKALRLNRGPRKVSYWVPRWKKVALKADHMAGMVEYFQGQTHASALRSTTSRAQRTAPKIAYLPPPT
eukprot:RCo055190